MSLSVKKYSVLAGTLACLSAGIVSSQVKAAAASSLHAVIKNEPTWVQFKSSFVKRDGRVVDNANGNIAHSEGQGFAMLMAVAADDSATFDSIWQFTRSKLGVRKDNLLAWRWKPGIFGGVKDKNNATDGDILIAWALLEASEAGFGTHYRKQALAILRDIKKLVKQDDTFGNYLLPAKFGFTADHHRGKNVINVSYWVYPAFERIEKLTGDRSWKGLMRSGDAILRRASANRSGLPSDWNTLKRHKGAIGTHYKFNSEFSYNAIRVPLYLAWSKTGSFDLLEGFQKNWVQRGSSLMQVNVKSNRARKSFRNPGYSAVAAIIDCSVSGTAFPSKLRRNLDKTYYPASLQMLSIIATKQRYPQCW